MKVIVICEENHGDIGIATTMKAAFQFLIDTAWLNWGFEMWDKTTDTWYTVRDVFASRGIEETKANLLAWCLENQDDYNIWDGAFYFHEENIVEEENW